MVNNNFNSLFPVNPQGLDDIARSLLENAPSEDDDFNLAPPPNINPSEYVRFQGGKILVPKYEQEEFKNTTYEEAHKKVLQKGLVMPTPKQFMPYVVHIIDAYNHNKPLHDGEGKVIPHSEVEEIYKHLTQDYKNGGAWSWLNARFVEGTGFHNLNLETVVGIDAKGELLKKSVPLKKTMEEDRYVSIQDSKYFNEQGFPLQELGSEYDQGKNIYFWAPKNGLVAGFVADSVRAGLGCYWDPSYSNPSLGVFACAVGARVDAAKNQGGNKK